MSSSIDWAYPAYDADGEAAVVVVGNLQALLPRLSGDRMIVRSCAQVLPFGLQAGAWASVVEAALAMEGVSAVDTAPTWRVVTWPRALEQPLADALASSLSLSPSEFTHILTVVRLGSGGGGSDDCAKDDSSRYVFSALDRTLWDPRAWREKQLVSAAGDGGSKLARSLRAHLDESWWRLPVRDVCGRHVVVASDLGVEALRIMARWCVEKGARSATPVCPKRAADGAWRLLVPRDGGESLESSSTDAAARQELRAMGEAIGNGITIAFRYERGLEEAVLMLRELMDALACDKCTNTVAPGAPSCDARVEGAVELIGRVQLGRHARSRKVQEDISRACSTHGFAVRVHHLLCDKELDRTLVIRDATPSRLGSPS